MTKPYESAHESAIEYINAGFAPVPIPFREKKPTIPEWQKLRISPTDVDHYFNGRPQNIGLILGVGGLTDVDLDAQEATAAALELLPETPFRYGRQSKPASHYMYVCDPVPATRQYKCPLTGASLCELRGLSRNGETGAQSVVPPSSHPSGELIRFESGCGPQAAAVQADALARAVARVAAAALLARHWPAEGSRNQAFLALAGVLARAGWMEEEAAQFVRAIYRALWGASADLRQADAEVAHTFNRFCGGGDVTGLPTLAQLIPEKVLKSALNWLGIASNITSHNAGGVGISGRVECEVTVGDIAALADKCEEILASRPDCDIYQQGGHLASIALIDGALVIREIGPDDLKLRISKHIRFYKVKTSKLGAVKIECDVPKDLPAMMLARVGEWRYRRLRGVSASPLLRRDGSVACGNGYDAGSMMLMVGVPDVAIPNQPTKQDAVVALSSLMTLLQDFPFAEYSDSIAAVSAIMTAVLRPSIGPCPMHLISAPVAGSGKTYLYEIAGAIATGKRPPVVGAAGASGEEIDKRVTAALLSPAQTLCLDNLAGTLESDILCQAISSDSEIRLRPLGRSEMVAVTPSSAIFATGNNVRVSGDLLRRTIPIRLSPAEERPELRQFPGSPLRQALDGRKKYLTDVMTIVSAYVTAGKPGVLPKLAGFDGWSDLVRSSLYWLTGVDVCDAMEALRAEDPARDEFSAAIHALKDVFGKKPFTVTDLAAALPASQALRGALDHLLEGGNLNRRRAGRYLMRWSGVKVGGLRLHHGVNPHAKISEWRIVEE